MIVVKTLTSFLAFIYLFGLAWSSGSTDTSTLMLVLICSSSGILMSLLPDEYLRKLNPRIVISIIVPGILSLLALIVIDMSRSYGVDIIGVFINVIFISLLIVLGKSAMSKIT